jgi:hypothetical protein
MASRAALIMARAVHDLQPETGRRVFSTNDSLVKIFPRKEVYWKPQSTTINPWSNDTEIAITRMAEVQITSRTIGPPFRQREMIIPNLVYILDLLPDDAGCVTAMNPLAHRSRIVETGEAEELARFLHAIFDEDAEA